MRILLLTAYFGILACSCALSTGVNAMQRPMSKEEMRQMVNHVAVGTVEKIDASTEEVPTGEVIQRSRMTFKVIHSEKGTSASEISLYGSETLRRGDAPGGLGIVGLSTIRTGDKVRFYFFDPYDTPDHVLAAFETLSSDE